MGRSGAGHPCGEETTHIQVIHLDEDRPRPLTVQSWTRLAGKPYPCMPGRTNARGVSFCRLPSLSVYLYLYLSDFLVWVYACLCSGVEGYIQSNTNIQIAPGSLSTRSQMFHLPFSYPDQLASVCRLVSGMCVA